MDPISALLFAYVVAGLFVRNVTQDLVYKVRGEDPPSYRRELERRKRRDERRANPTAARKFWVNAWDDAWAGADEHRARVVKQAAERRQRRWTAMDEAAQANDEHVRASIEGPRCPDCGDAITEGQARELVVDGVPTTFCARCWVPRVQVDDGAAAGRKCRVCGEATRDAATGAMCSCVINPMRPRPPGMCARCSVWAEPGDPDRLCRLCREIETWERTQEEQRARARRPAAPPEDAPDPGIDPGPAGPATIEGRVVDLDTYRRANPIPAIKECDIDTINASAETTNLGAALTYTQEQAARARDFAASVETSVATLTAGGVTGPAITSMTAAQEAFAQAAAALESAYAELTGHLGVREAYASAQGAGTREFVTQD